MFQAFLFSLLIIAICVCFLGVRLLFGRSFVHTHVEGNKELRRRGITCIQSQDAAERRAGKGKRVSESAEDKK